MTLELNIFRFDAASDYLPYYKKYFIKINEQKTLLDLFNQINSSDNFDFKKDENFCVVVNKKYTTLSISIEKLVKIFGKDLTIEPISIRRCNKDFIINDDDFTQKLQILEEFTNEEDIKEYLDNKIVFYASNTLNHFYEYIGDPIILLAHKIIERTPNIKEKVLDILQNQEYSVQYHTSLKNLLLDFDEDIEKKINQVKNELGFIKEPKEQNFNLDSSCKVNFHKYDINLKIKHDFEGFNLAYYYTHQEDSEVKEFLKKLNIKRVYFENENIDLNLESFHVNQNLTIKLAATVMLEAFDGGADLLIVDSDEVFKLFDTNRKSLSKAVGREVIIPVLHKSELFNLAYDNHDIIINELINHKINPEII